jgi:hypothetical protein
MRNVRRHFRLDVVVPAVIKLADKDHVVRLVLPELSGGVWERNEVAADRAQVHLNDLLLKENEAAGKVTVDLFARIQLLAESILCLVQGYNLRDKIPNYKTRRHTVALVTYLKTGSATVDMLRALNDKIEFYFSVVEMASEKKYDAFLEATKSATFAFDAYLSGLEAKSSGSLLAQCVLALHHKLARHIVFVDKFRQEAIYLVDKTAWPLRKLNLSAGGVGFLSQDPYPKFARLSIDFRLGSGSYEKTFNMTGNIVSSRALSDNEHYIAVEFTNATEAIQQQIIMYLQNEELNQVIAMLQLKQASQE